MTSCLKAVQASSSTTWSMPCTLCKKAIKLAFAMGREEERSKRRLPRENPAAHLNRWAVDELEVVGLVGRDGERRAQAADAQRLLARLLHNVDFHAAAWAGRGEGEEGGKGVIQKCKLLLATNNLPNCKTWEKASGASGSDGGTT